MPPENYPLYGIFTQKFLLSKPVTATEFTYWGMKVQTHQIGEQMYCSLTAGASRYVGFQIWHSYSLCLRHRSCGGFFGFPVSTSQRSRLPHPLHLVMPLTTFSQKFFLCWRAWSWRYSWGINNTSYHLVNYTLEYCAVQTFQQILMEVANGMARSSTAEYPVAGWCADEWRLVVVIQMHVSGSRSTCIHIGIAGDDDPALQNKRLLTHQCKSWLSKQ